MRFEIASVAKRKVTDNIEWNCLLFHFIANSDLEVAEESRASALVFKASARRVGSWARASGSVGSPSVIKAKAGAVCARFVRIAAGKDEGDPRLLKGFAGIEHGLGI